MNINIFASSLLDSLNQEQKQWLQEHPEITAHNESDYIPINFFKNNKPQGYSIDYMDLLAKKLGIKVKYISGHTWNRYLLMAKDKKIDLMLNIVQTKEREKYLNFTKPYLKLYPFIYSNSLNKIDSVEKLEGKTLAFPKGYYFEKLFKKNYPQIKLLRTKDNLEAIKAVSLGNADATLGLPSTFEYLINDHFITNVVLSGEAKMEGIEKYFERIGVRKEWKIFREILDIAIDSVTYQELAFLKEKWNLLPNKIEGIGNNDFSLTKEQLQWIKENPVIKVGGETDWPPFDYVENGEYMGIAKDYLDLISKKTGLEFDVVTGYTWSELLAMAKNKELDLLPMIYFSQERKKFLNFTDNYLDIRHYLYTLEDKSFNSLDELNGKKIAVPKGFAQAEILKKRYPLIKVYEAGNSLDCIDAVVTKKADAFIENTALVTYFLKKYGIKGIKASFSTNLGVNKLYMAARKDYPILRDIIQKALNNLDKKDIERINKEWLGGQAKIFLTAEEKKFLKARKSISMCVSPEALPIEGVSNGKHIGISADIMNEISSLINISVKFVKTQSWEESLKNASEGKCDILPAATKSDKPSFMRLTKPYLDYPVVILTRSDKSFVNSIESLKGKRVGIQENSEVLRSLKEEYPHINFIKITNTFEGLQKLTQNQIYAYIDISASTYIINKYGISDVKIAGFLNKNLEYSIGVNKNLPLLFSIIQKALDETGEKRVSEISGKWVNVKFEEPKDYSFLWRLLSIALIIVLILMIVNYYLNRRIKQEVKKQTSLKNYLQNLTNNTFDAIATINEKGEVLTWNKACENIFGYTYGEINGKNLHELIMPPEFMQKHKKGFGHFSKTGTGSLIGQVLEIEAIDKNGGKVPVEISINAIQYENKWHALGIIRDLRDTKKLQEKVERIEKQKKEIDSILNASSTILILNDGGDISRANSAFEKFFDQYDSFEDFKKEHHCICELFEKVDDENYISGSKIDGKNWVEFLSEQKEGNYKVAISQNGMLHHFLLDVGKIDLQDKNYYLIEMINITQEVVQADELEKKNRIIAEQSKMAALGEMIGNIAHQWRQPLSLISTTASSIKVKKEVGLEIDADTLEKDMDRIVQTSEYLSHTIDDFKNFIKGDKLKTKFLLKETLDKSLNLLHATLKSNYIMVEKELKGDIEIYGFHNELIQCLTNILNNSKDVLKNVKDEKDRIIKISADIIDDKAVIYIKDSGGGIDEDIIGKVFEPYFTTKHQSQGTGLGLYMTYKIITESMEGEISVSNDSFTYNGKEYEGASIRIILPVT